jgi:FkbM family methyltransferase
MNLRTRLVENLRVFSPPQIAKFFLKGYSQVAMSHALRNLASRDISVTWLIDVGAHNGEWTRLASRLFENSRILLIEPLSEKKQTLERIVGNAKRFVYRDDLISHTQGMKVPFFEYGTGSSLYREHGRAIDSKEKLTSTLDAVAKEVDIGETDSILLKLDVQGAELDVLQGATDVLPRVKCIVLEISLVPYNEGAPTFDDLFDALRRLNFALFDIAGEHRDPKNGRLLQVDMVFVPRTSNLIAWP